MAIYLWKIQTKDMLFLYNKFYLFCRKIKANALYFVNVFFLGKVIVGKNSFIRGSFPALDSNSKISLGKNSLLCIGENVKLKQGAFLSIPDNCTMVIQSNCTIQIGTILIGDIRIGMDSLIAPYSYISSFSHNISYWPRLNIKEADKLHLNSAPISIGSDVWIGFGVFIAPGCKIVDHVVLAANSSLLNDIIDEYSLYAGSPAKFKKSYRQS